MPERTTPSLAHPYGLAHRFIKWTNVCLRHCTDAKHFVHANLRLISAQCSLNEIWDCRSLFSPGSDYCDSPLIASDIPHFGSTSISDLGHITGISDLIDAVNQYDAGSCQCHCHVITWNLNFRFAAIESHWYTSIVWHFLPSDANKAFVSVHTLLCFIFMNCRHNRSSSILSAWSSIDDHHDHGVDCQLECTRYVHRNRLVYRQSSTIRRPQTLTRLLIFKHTSPGRQCSFLVILPRGSRKCLKSTAPSLPPCPLLLLHFYLSILLTLIYISDHSRFSLRSLNSEFPSRASKSLLIRVKVCFSLIREGSCSTPVIASICFFLTCSHERKNYLSSHPLTIARK